ncbi:MAG TPA: VWA domain-containing protein [Thermoanaerobaculia bacterium]|jgi:VWFA-related protein
MRRPVTPLIVLFLALPLVAQTPVIEKIDVNVVNVDVTVTDRAGNPVRGLTRDDFQIFEDGKAQKVTNFYAVTGAEGGGAPLVPDERFRRKVLVVVDNVTTSRYFRDRALDRLERFINDRFSGGDYEWSLALVDRRPHLLLAPTSDKQQIFSAITEIRKLVAGDVGRFTQNAVDDRPEPVAMNPLPDAGAASDASCSKIRLTGMLAAGDRLQLASSEGSAIASLTQAVRGFSSVDGKKIILLLTSDDVLSGTFDPFAITACMPANTEWDLQQAAKQRTGLADYLVREANASNVSLYIINTSGLRPGEWVRDDVPGVSSARETFVPPTDNSSLFWMATETGGRLLPGNDVAESLKTFDSVSSNFYSLGYRPAHAEDDKYHRIQVRLKKPGDFHLQYRDGYSSLSSREQIIRLLQSPLAPAMQASSLTLEVTIGSPVDRAKKEVLVPISVSVSTRDLTFVSGAAAPVEVFFSLFDANGRNISLLRFDREAKSGGGSFVERHALKLRKGQHYRVVIAIRDPLTDAFGIAQQAVRF